MPSGPSGWRLPAALGLAAAVALAGWLARPRSPAGWPPPLPPPASNPAPNFTTSIDIAEVLPHQVLSDQRAERDGRRVIRRVILIAYDADRKQVKATLFTALQQLLREEGASTDLAYVWAVPDRGLAKPGLLDDLLPIVSGRLYHIADGKGLGGRTANILTTSTVDMLIDDKPPARQDLALVVAAASAVADRRAAGGREDQRTIMQRFAAGRGIPYANVAKALERVLAHYPMLPRELLAPGAG